MTIGSGARRLAASTAAFVLLVVALRFFQRVSYDPSAALLVYRAPIFIAGDEPHYLMLVHSILFDHDLDLRSDYERVEKGGIQAGARFRGSRLDHHTIWLDRATGRHGHGSRNKPVPEPPTLVERSAHPIAFPALLAAALALAHTSASQVEWHAHLLVTFLAASTVLLTYVLGRAVGARRKGALLACALLVFASPWVCYAGSLYSEPLQGLFLAAALLALARGRPAISGAFFGGALLVKPALVLVPATVFIWLWVRRRRSDAMLLAAWAGSCGFLLAVFNFWQTREIAVSGLSGWIENRTLEGFVATWIEPTHGLLVFVPWVGIAMLALVRSFQVAPAGAGREGEPLQAMAVGVAPMAVLFSAYGNTGGDCFGPRFWVPFLPWFVVAAVIAFDRGTRGLKAALLLLAFVGAVVAIPGTLLRGEARMEPAFSPAVSLASGFPSWSRQIERIVRLHLRRAGL